MSAFRKRFLGHSVIEAQSGFEGLDMISSARDNAEEPLGEKTNAKAPTPKIAELGNEKGPHSSGEEKGLDVEIEDDDPVLKDIPWHVRRVVSLHDDPTLPTLTFRYFVLTILFVAPGAFLGQLTNYRTTFAPYSVFFVQIASNYVGLWLADILPAAVFRIPFTKFSFSLNPGPWSVKEHVLVTISAASGATYNLAYAPISISELYLGYQVPAAVAIFFMWAIVWTGYSFAAIARQFLLYDPEYPWFQALCQTALFETQKKQNLHPTPLSRRQMHIFFLVLGAVTLWQFLPEFVFPMLGSLAFLCWVAPNNATANFLGAGFGGMGFLNLSLDWSNISNLSNSGSLFLTPFWTQLIIFLAFVLNCWILIPAAKWGKLGSPDHIMSNRLFTEDGLKYPVLDLITPEMTFNETAYEENGPIILGSQFLWSLFFGYASFSSALSWMAFFGFSQIRRSIQKFRKRHHQGGTINEQYGDQLNILQRSYPEVPLWWYLALFIVSFVIVITIIACGHMFIPVWTYFIAILTGAIVVVPLGWLYAVSNFQLPIGYVNELFYGLMVNTVSGYKNPAGASAYGSLAGDAWYRAQLMLQDQKIGHYMHIPQRAVFFSQIFGSFIGIPINYGVIRWVLNTKSEYLNGKLDDPTHQWTGQSLASYFALGVQYVIIGPQRLFSLPSFAPVPYGFLLGIGIPPIIYGLHRLFPRAKFHLWNSTIFFAGMGNFYGNISTGYLSGIIGGYVVMYWAYRHKYELWSRYNYIVAAAFDAGFNLNLLFIFLFFGAGKVILMPNWWGNDAASSERCFSLKFIEG